MAYNRTNAARSTETQDDSWKAAGFMNFKLELPGQQPVTMPSMPLKGDTYKNLIEFLEKDPTNAQKLVQYLKVEYRANAPKAKVFDFSVLG